MEKIQPTRQQIIEDVRLWSKNFLEVSNVHLGGVPACPFAKKAWADDKVWIAVKTKHSTYKKELNDCIKNLDFTKKEISTSSTNWAQGGIAGVLDTENKEALEALGGKLIFAGPHKDDDNKMIVLIDFDSPEAMKAFATDEELKAKRVAAGAILESNVVTVMGDESFMS